MHMARTPITASGTQELPQNQRVSAWEHQQLMQLWEPKSEVWMQSLETGRSLVCAANFTDVVDTAVL